MIKACDTDILVLAVSVFETLQDAGLEELWIEFGQGQSIRWLPVHDMVEHIGPEKSRGHTFSFTPSLAVMSYQPFVVKAKSCMANMGMCPEVSHVFQKLSQYPPVTDDADLSVIEKFVITMYDKNNTADGLMRQDLTYLLGSKGPMMPFHLQGHPLRST